MPTHHTRVERWECDHNDHWNARFYGRSFQLAAETVAAMAGGENPGAAVIGSRHIRFHRELFSASPVEVRSLALAGGAHDGAIVHLLIGSGRLAAVALDLPGKGAERLPVASAGEIGRLLPRNFGAAPREWDAGAGATIELPPARPAEFDHTGALLFEEIVRRNAVALHDYLARLGYSPEYMSERGVGRMAAEMHVTRLGNCRPGAPLRASSRLGAVGVKSFTTMHRIHTHAGEPVAAIEQTLLAVDMNTRRTIEIPGFLRGLSG